MSRIFTEKSIIFLFFSALLFLLAFFIENLFVFVFAFVSLLISGFFTVAALWKFRIIERDFEIKTRGFSSLTENLTDGVVLYDADFIVLSMNRALEELFGVRREKYLGNRIQPKTGLSGGEALLMQCLFPSLAATSTQISEAGASPQVVEISTENPSRRFLTSLSRVDDEKNPYFIKTVRDATREKEVLESKSEFVSVAAHQLRTPLTSINWALESIVKDSDGVSEPIQKNATEALRVSERTLKIVNNLLEVAKMDEGKTTFSKERVIMAEFLRNIIKLSEQFAKERSVSLFLVPVPPEWENAAVMIDKEQLGTALINLIENAVKYNSKQGETSVMLEIFPERGILKISVKDTGIGIPEKDKNAVFSKFFRSKNATQLEPNGSGLGLYIVKSIIERHGGHVGFESRESRGSTFWFVLPLARVTTEEI